MKIVNKMDKNKNQINFAAGQALLVYLDIYLNFS